MRPVNILIFFFIFLIIFFPSNSFGQTKSLRKAFKSLNENNLNEFVEYIQNIKKEDSSNFLFFYCCALYKEKSEESDLETRYYTILNNYKQSIEKYILFDIENKNKILI